MQFHLGGIPDARDFVPDESWKPLREPGPWLMQLLALPIGFGAFAAIGFLWFWTTPLSLTRFESPDFLVCALISFVPLIAIHELIHAVVHPKSGRSDRSILGFWPSRLLFYSHYDGELTRNRFIAILAMPTVILTLLPLAVGMATNSSHELAAWLSTWNAFFACGDLFGIILLCFQVRRRAICRNKGWRTYWKCAIETAGESPTA